MKINEEIIFYNKDKISVKDNDKFVILEENARTEKFSNLQTQIAKEDKIRRICTKTIFVLLCIGAIIYGIWGKPNGDLWFVIFLLSFVGIWAILYLVCGFVFYPKIKINWHFKDIKSPLNDKCITYYSSHYRVYIEKYAKFLGNVDFTYTPNANKRKRQMIGFSLVEPKKRAFIFNGKISSNIPYFAFYMKKGKKLFFFPGFVIYLAGKLTKIIPIKDFKVEIDTKTETPTFTYLKTSVYNKDELIETFYISNNFNTNFFNFKF